MAAAPDYVMVAAIDFGTTFSGYAFSFRSNKEEMILNKSWGEALGIQSYKAPTTVLTNKDGEFVAFGYEAEEKYMEFDDDEDDDEDVAREETVEASLASAVVPFHKNLYKHFKMMLHKKESGCINKRGSSQLVIALEPEAASYYCRQLKLAQYENPAEISLKSGKKYLILDCGGGTNDMVVHQVVLDHTVKELCAANGGSWGGVKIDEKFVSLLKQILGARFIEKIKHDFPRAWFSLINKFERAKRAAKSDGKHRLSIEVPWLLIEQYSVLNPNDTLDKAIKRSTTKGIAFNQGMLILANHVVQSVFEETIQHIIQSMQKLLEDNNIVKLNYIFMVGGLCESEILQDAVKKTFAINNCKVLIPSEAQLAITKGAVLYGHNQGEIVSRVARKTYGIDTAVPFNHLTHDSKRRYSDSEGRERCRNVFLPFVTMGDEVKVGSTIEQVYELLRGDKQRTCRLCSMPRKPNKPVQYSDDPDVTKLGDLVVDVPSTVGTPGRQLLLRMTFGSTEILIEATDQSTGNMFNIAIDFLSE